MSLLTVRGRTFPTARWGYEGRNKRDCSIINYSTRVVVWPTTVQLCLLPFVVVEDLSTLALQVLLVVVDRWSLELC